MNSNEINPELLKEYGYEKDESKSTSLIQVFTFNQVDISINSDGIACYTNMGFDYILKNEADLLKIYKELRRENLIKK